MSRASDVRDVVMSELQTRLPDLTVEAFVIPNYTRETLEDGKIRVAVRSAGRRVVINQGPDERYITIEIGVVGLIPRLESRRENELAAVDEIDAIVESIIAFWSPNGPLRDRGFSDHRFAGEITQNVFHDMQSMYADGIFLSVISIPFFDCLDEYEE